MTDYHCHILPRMDDGAKHAAMSIDMIRLMEAQGIDRMIATPHFYAHYGESVEAYLRRRQEAYEKIAATGVELPEIRLGAEVAIEQGISRLSGIETLSMGGSPHILLEFPYAPFAHWMLEEIFAISQRYALTPVLAHVHRYVHCYTKSQLEEVLQTDAVFQINTEAFFNFRERRFALSLIRRGFPYLFGSDAHNMSSRRPNWDMFLQKVKPEILNHAETLNFADNGESAPF